jgi:hypothetical protein
VLIQEPDVDLNNVETTSEKNNKTP